MEAGLPLSVIRNPGKDSYEQRYDCEVEALQKQIRVVKAEEINQDDGANHQKRPVYGADTKTHGHAVARKRRTPVGRCSRDQACGALIPSPATPASRPMTGGPIPPPIRSMATDNRIN